ncbi:MAG: site-specific DNA-methyltransferase [Proteobacteria bacterium]|nr:site-specific DNA-methyltransferase [Pseudomonadota bacterium]
MKKSESKKNGADSSLEYRGKRAANLVLQHMPARLTLVRKVTPALLDATAPPSSETPEKMLISGDNLAILSSLIESKNSGTLLNGDSTPGARLVYIDPPFSSLQTYKTKKAQKAYEDHLSGAQYLEFLRTRLILIRELMADNGSIYVHLDWKMAHHIKVVMDELFGAENFLNDIIWHYGGRGAKAVSGQFSRNHDIILLYRKKKHIFNRLYTTRAVEGRTVQRDEEGRPFKTAPRGDYTDASIEKLRAEGRIHTTKTGNIRIKYFLDETAGGVVDRKLVGDVWDDIPDAMHMAKAEKSGYPTQKPEALLRRIIEASTNPGDLVIDAFAGSGTTLVAAEKLGRAWIGIDSSPVAIETAEVRLRDIAASKGYRGKGKKRYASECSQYSLYTAK